jgi:hypothetical protein
MLVDSSLIFVVLKQSSRISSKSSVMEGIHQQLVLLMYKSTPFHLANSPLILFATYLQLDREWDLIASRGCKISTLDIKIIEVTHELSRF